MRRIMRRMPLPPTLRQSYALSWYEEIRRHYDLPPEERVRRRAPKAAHVLESPELTTQLLDMQRGKCAYCEVRLSHSLTIEHYRPLSNASGGDSDGQDSPDHYAWFALEWRNLMLTCPECSMAKANSFPVTRRRAPPLSTWNQAQREKPLLINPYTIEVERHIDFDRRGAAVPVSPRGEATIDILGLNRSQLVESRAWVIQRVAKMLRAPGSDPAGLLELVHPKAEHCGAAAIYLRTQLLRARFHLDRSRDIVHQIRKLLRSGELIGALSKARDRGEDLSFRARSASPLVESAKADAKLQAIRGINIRSFMSVDQLSLDLPPRGQSNKAACLMVLGENGAGKSSILKAIALSLAGKEGRDALELKRDMFTSRHASNWESISTDPTQVKLSFGNGIASTFHWDATGYRQEHAGAALPPVLAYGAHRLAGKGSTQLGPVASLFNPEIALPSPIEWLASLDDHLFDAAARALRVVLALKRDDRIYRDDKGTVLARVQGRVSPIEQLSDGYRSLFSMVVDMMKGLLKGRGDLEYARGVVLIDEIEGHLHPRWKMRIVRALRDAFPGVQFILTTHDPLCLRGMEKGEVVVVYRNGSGEMRTRDGLPDVSSLRVDQLLTSELFGLNSATDPSMDRVVHELAEIVGMPPELQTPALRERRDALLCQFPGIDTIGSDVGRQIVAEAITRHLREDGVADIRLRADARRDSVNKIIEVLRAEESRLESGSSHTDAEGVGA
ncbi:ATP-binding cassette domain-containing protein [Stenotrophomonas maltophilia]|nr:MULTISPECIES: AAA family ATPase [Stenotrophomonas maltophilia group]TIK68202.1 ATP-binding cassette domain-containing protein [Stenotrophomonas maltophilia]TIK75500.1 ATP-binding cassette domain-containing protein [Stenotrophomonas maltophilia]